jgi:60 kDa SS-A/Ro ribonucleoprotein
VRDPAGEQLDLRDVIRIAHPASDTPERAMLFRWLAGKAEDAEAAQVLPAVDNFMIAKAVTTPAEAIRVITERRVPWEFLPSDVLKNGDVWAALVETIGMTALIRNCARMTRIGTLAPFAQANATVVRRLTSAEALAKGRIHPMDAYLALRVYASGQITRDVGKGKSDTDRWAPVAEITDALEEAFYLAHGHVQPSGKRMIVAVDSSGSMAGWSQVTFNGAQLGSAYEVGCAIATMLKRIEGENAHVIDVDTSVHASKITARTNLREIKSWRPSGGGTDLSLPMTYAMRENLRVDGFALLTDNMTWAGRAHPFQTLETYRKSYNPGARFADVSMVPSGHTIADPGSPGVINMAGMDASLLVALAGYFRAGE